MTQIELKDRIVEALNEHYFKDENGLYYNEVYADYRDKLDDETAKEILKSRAPMEVLTEKMSEWYQESVWTLEDQAIDTLRNDSDLEAAYEENEDLFRDTLFELFYIKEPFDHYLKQDVEINIVLDTGNMNYDCTLDGFAHGYYGGREGEVDPRSSLLWLCEQQGVSKAELEQALKTGECYPKDITGLLNRHSNIIRQLKDLGYVPNKPMDHYNQKGAFKTLVQAESRVRNHTRSLEKYRANLADCELCYEEFCDKWASIPGNKKFARTPPAKDVWERRRSETRTRLLEAISLVETQLSNDKAYLEEVLKEPGVAAAATLRNQLSELAEPFATMKRSEEYKKGRFLETVIQESANVTSHMNTLTALVKMPLNKAMELTEVVNEEAHMNESYIPEERIGRSSIVLSADTVIGLYDPWYGSGSMFDIALRKSLEVPVRMIHDANIDGNLGYSINAIYGGMDYGETLEDIRAVIPEPVKTPLDQVLENAQNTSHMQQENQNASTQTRTHPSER